MLFTARTATILIAIALIGWGIIHFLAGDFIVGRAPSWPEGFPGKLLIAYITGVLLIVSAVVIVLRKQKTSWLVTSLAVLILGWAGGRNLWIVLSNLDYGGTLTNFGKAITIGSGLLLIASDLKEKKENPTQSLFTLTSICIGIFFLIGGIQHFIFIDFVQMLVPAWIPGAVFWSYLAGVGLIASGIALITGIQRKLAAMVAAYMVFTWFLILHIPRGFGETASFNEWIAIFESLFVAALLMVIYYNSEEKVG